MGTIDIPRKVWDQIMKKILVAEDEQAIREFVVINLKRAGYDAYEAENGEQALGDLRAGRRRF